VTKYKFFELGMSAVNCYEITDLVPMFGGKYGSRIAVSLADCAIVAMAVVFVGKT
jgi:hypothetical protein